MLRPGQKPCYSVEYKCTSKGYNLLVNTFIIKRYQILVTDMGRRLEGSEVVRSGLGMAVRSVCSNSGSEPVSNSNCRAAVRRSATPGNVQNCCRISELIPYTPTAVAGRRSVIAEITSCEESGADRVYIYYGERHGTSTKISSKSVVYVAGEVRLKKEEKWSTTYYYVHSTIEETLGLRNKDMRAFPLYLVATKFLLRAQHDCTLYFQRY